jgi:hypothetical protein
MAKSTWSALGMMLGLWLLGAALCLGAAAGLVYLLRLFGG